MKKYFIIGFAIIVIVSSIVTLTITFGSTYRHPVTTNVIVKNLENSHHDLKVMKKAKNVLIEYFKAKYEGCILKTIFYDEKYDRFLDGTYNKDKYYDIIVLTADVKTDKLQENLKPNAKVTLNFIIGKKIESVDYHVLDVEVVE